MSRMTIMQFTGRPEVTNGLEWYNIVNVDSIVGLPPGVLKSNEGSVLLARGDVSPEEFKDASGDIVTTWHGARVFSTGSARRGQVTYIVRFPVPEHLAVEFDAWYRFEHIPLLQEEPTWYASELLRAVEPSSFTFTAIHYLESLETLKSIARHRSRETPWWTRLAKNEWWDTQFVRTLLRPIA